MTEIERLAIEWLEARENLARYKRETPRSVRVHPGGIMTSDGDYDPPYPNPAYVREINKQSAATQRLLRAARKLRQAEGK